MTTLDLWAHDCNSCNHVLKDYIALYILNHIHKSILSRYSYFSQQSVTGSKRRRLQAFSEHWIPTYQFLWSLRLATEFHFSRGESPSFSRVFRELWPSTSSYSAWSQVLTAYGPEAVGCDLCLNESTLS